MICPNCLENAEIAYSALSETLICLSPGCDWERHLDEDETFELFFGSRKCCHAAEEAEGFEEVLVHHRAS